MSMVNSSSSNNHHYQELKFSNPLSVSKFKPLIPRPTIPMSPLSAPFSCGCCFQTAGNKIACIPHLSNYGESKRGIEPLVMSSCRWNPTREQLHALEDMYEKGMRTPTAEQIKQIATRLRRFGKIEGKNVFYWFQNHKARERQKRRRLMNLIHMHAHAETLDMEHTGLSNKKTMEEAEETKQWATISGSSTVCEDSESINKATVTTESVREIGLTQYGAKGFHKQQTRIYSCNRKANKYNLSFSSNMPLNQNLFKELSGENQILLGTWKPTSKFLARNVENERRENIQTLELFPLGRGKTTGSREDSDFIINKTITTPNHQFFEFLPIMN